jgi:hypothetical protein
MGEETEDGMITTLELISLILVMKFEDVKSLWENEVHFRIKDK